MRQFLEYLVYFGMGIVAIAFGVVLAHILTIAATGG